MVRRFRSILAVALLCLLNDTAVPSVVAECHAGELAQQIGFGKNSPKIDAYGSEHESPSRRQTASNNTNWQPIRILVQFDLGDCSTPAVSGNTRCGHCTSDGQLINDHTSQGSTTTRTCTAADVLTAGKKTYLIDHLMPAAVAYFQKAMKVQRLSSAWSLGTSSNLCGTTPVNASHKSPGVDGYDFVAHVTAYPFDNTSKTVASAGTCRTDSTTLRPLAAHVNWNPKQLVDVSTTTIDAAKFANQLATTLHELTHAFGFDGLPWFPNGILQLNGSVVKSTGYSEVVRNGKTVTIMTSPRVVREARLLFDCPTLDGVEIEDGGNYGTYGVHWEKRLFETEYMNGVDTSPLSYLSPVTFGWFEDSTWYRMDYSYCQNASLLWGRNKGCDFVTKPCNTVGVKERGEYCFSGITDTMKAKQFPYDCLQDRTAVGICRGTTFDIILPTYYQYFTSISSSFGGLQEASDYCPTVQYSRSCISTLSADSDPVYGNAYNPNSRCYVSTLINKSYTSLSPRQARCFTTYCDTSRIVLVVDGVSVNCSADGTEGNVTMPDALAARYYGYITCPAYSAVCLSKGKFVVQVDEIARLAGVTTGTVEPIAEPPAAGTNAPTTTVVTSETTTTTGPSSKSHAPPSFIDQSVLALIGIIILLIIVEC